MVIAEPHTHRWYQHGTPTGVIVHQKCEEEVDHALTSTGRVLAGHRFLKLMPTGGLRQGLIAKTLHEEKEVKMTLGADVPS